MVPLRTLIGKLIHKAHADLMTLTDTLPSMSDVEKKRQILTYSTFIRKQFLKLLNIMAFLANQNKIFQDTVDYLHKIHLELPAARLRNFDIPTAVDVLTTGTYQRMPTKIKDMMAPTPLTDEEVLETFHNMNDVIRMRMITTEVLPSPMRNYRIENGRIYFSIENEFEVVLTLMGHSNDRRWWIVSLDVFVRASSLGKSSEDVDITLNDTQKQHLQVNAQKQLVPPALPEDPSQPSNNAVANPTSSTPVNNSKPLFFPLVNMYDYLHLSCLHMQLEIIYVQAAMLCKTRWINQLKVQMNQDRTKLTLIYWRGGSPTSHWGKPQSNLNALKSTVIEIAINNKDYDIRDELKGLVQKAGIGASIALSDVNASDQHKVLTSLKYPKNTLEVLWNDNPELYTNAKLIESSDLNIERLVLHVTNYHGKCIIDKFRETLISEKSFLEENGLNASNIIYIDTKNKSPSLVVRYRHQRYISIEADSRTGRIKAFDTSDGCSEGDLKLRGLEDRLNNDPKNIARHLLWIRSEVVVREVIALAKQLNLQPYHPSQMNLRTEDLTKLFGDVIGDATANTTNTTNIAVGNSGAIVSNSSKYPSHCVFLQFPQFEDWYFVIAIIRNEFKSWLCCINKTYDQNGLYHAIVDLTYFDCIQLWKDQFIGKKSTTTTADDVYSINKNKRHLEDIFEEPNKIKEEEQDMIPDTKRRRKSSVNNDNNYTDGVALILPQNPNKIDK
ncbi:MAG: mediator complex subunit MED14-domain-containing protein [Benjaminiella poitrasii]|nr:MAG: mediator complex subunit MED14-domain-containing protein [Benjaminiella poitrasii]